MNITILTYGSRGDVQPFLALAVGLQKTGYQVNLAAPHRFADFVAQRNVPFAPLAGDPEEISKAFNDAGHNALKVASAIRDYVNSIVADVARVAFAACDDADLIIHSFLFTTGDQAFWGKRIHAIGAGPRPILIRALTGARLASALAEAEESALRDRARLLGRAIRIEDGVGNAIRVVESRLVA